MASKYPTVPENADADAVGSMSLNKARPGEVIPAHLIPPAFESAFIAKQMRHSAMLKEKGLREKHGAVRAPIKPRNMDVTGTGAQSIHFVAPGNVARKIAAYVQKKFKVKVRLSLAQESRDVEASIIKYDTAGRAYVAASSHAQLARMKSEYAKEKSAAKGKIMPFHAWVGATVVPEINMQIQ